MIAVPPSLNDATFEDVLLRVTALAPSEPLVVDARKCTFATPYALVALLSLAQMYGEDSELLVPEDAGTLRRWVRAGFLRHASDVYRVSGAVPELRPAVGGLLLEVTRLAKGAGSQDSTEHIRERVLRMLTTVLQLESRTAIGLTVALSEWCQTVIDESPLGGWVMAQCYQYGERLGSRNVAVIAVCDAGTGIRRASESGRGGASDSRSDAAALEAEVVRRDGPDGGRFKDFRGPVARLQGKFTVRSGTARIAMVPSWDDEVPRRENLAPFPGTQVEITVPGRGVG